MRLALALPAAACATAAAAAWVPWADTSLNVSQIVAQLPEDRGVFLGSPSLLRLPDGSLLASHDFFGAGYKVARDAAYTLRSADGGQTWRPAGSVAGMYWATLFSRPGDAAVYLFGVSGDGNHGVAQLSIARSTDAGESWAPAATLTGSRASYSTGPTPVLLHGGRLWRAFEHNTGPGWASGYAALVASAPADAPDLTDPRAWTLSGELNFSSVAPLVPPAWRAPYPLVAPAYGWLEGGVVPPPDGGPGVSVLLRVNSRPAANKAALLRVAAPDAAPTFVQWVDPFPGGTSKFTVRRDDAGGTRAPPATGLYVALANNVADASVTLPPTCGAVALPAAPVPCCGFIEACAAGPVASCMWCHADARNNLTLAVSADLVTWAVARVVLADDTGVPQYLSELGTGFQYVDWQFDGASGQDILYAVRAGYRGANNYHNSNRVLYGVISDWRAGLPAAAAAAAAAASS